MANIKIENLKNISLLEFEIPAGGVHILTSVNGSGKTTLLTCLERLANPFAYQKHFRTTSNKQFDNFQTAKITYSHNNASVSYKYKNTNWSPTPKTGSALLKAMGFPKVIFLTSTGERFYIQNQELDSKKIISAPAFFKDSMNEIFQTLKFSELRRVKLSGKGKGDTRRNFGFLLPTTSQGGQNIYFTEKNFSLGEVLILNALFELNTVNDNTLVLIDEVELALHPKVQVNFLRFLQRIAGEKKLTVIISTHSSSLIKSAPKLIYLERQNSGRVNVEYDCFPAIALQNVAIEEEVQPDIVFFVEDLFAKYLFEEFLNYYFKYIYASRRPIIKVLPVAGYKETIIFTEASSVYLIPRNTKVYCFLDADVKDTLSSIQTKTQRTASEQEKLDLFNRNDKAIKYLPITPELGIVQLLRNQPNQHIQPLQQHFNEVFDIAQIIQDENNRKLTYSENPREAAKKRIEYIIDRLKQATNRDINQIKIMLAQYFIADYGSKNIDSMKALLNPIFN